MSLDKKIRYEKGHPINWENGKCCICNLPLEIKAKGDDVNAKEMDYLDLFIRKQPKFVINVLEDKELKKSTVLKSLSDYYNVFLEFTKVFLLLEDSIKRMIYFDEITEKDLKDFCEKDCAEFNNFPERLEQINKFKVKSISKKISRLTIQLMGFVYTRMMNFSNSDF